MVLDRLLGDGADSSSDTAPVCYGFDYGRAGSAVGALVPATTAPEGPADYGEG